MNNPSVIELLAPARDRETGQAAISCGADAVYIGAPRFGAREAAGNPIADIAALATYAHRFRARVYVTLNTLLYEHELEAARQQAIQLWEAGADALIIQDTALLEMDLPPIPLFASTQMHNHTPARVAFLQKVGIRRAILARELTLEDIRAIHHAAPGIELETFVHGALCVGYSGQCYLSCALGGRSGNRGQCAQPCRREYDLLDRAGQVVIPRRYLLSLRDLNLSQDLGALLDAGVTSFKIEGRLKDKTYVMNVTAHYRRKLDALLPRRGLQPLAAGRVELDFDPDPRKGFNRGFTRHFLHGRREPVGSPDTPKSLGEPLGRVQALSAQSFTLDGEAEIVPGDGLCFFNRQRELCGLAVSRAEGRTVFSPPPAGLEAGTLVYRNHNQAFTAQLEHSKSRRRIPVRLRLAETRAGLALLAQDEEGNEAMATAELEFIPAEKPQQAAEAIERQLRRLGESDFECVYLRSDLPDPRFIPLGVLNGLRRDVLEALAQERAQAYNRPQAVIQPNDTPYPQRTLGFEGNVLNPLAERFYRRHGVEEVHPAAESGLDLQGERVMVTKHCLRHQYGWCATFPNPKAPPIPRPEEPLALRDGDGRLFPLRFNCAACVMEVWFGGKTPPPGDSQ